MGWDWTYAREELEAAFSGEVAPGVSFDVVGGNSLFAECRVYLSASRLNGGYTYSVMSVHGDSRTGYVGVWLDGGIAAEVCWPTSASLSFVVDRDELRGLCVAVRGSRILEGIARRISDEVVSLEGRIRSLLSSVGADGGERNVDVVRRFLKKNCLEVTSE